MNKTLRLLCNASMLVVIMLSFISCKKQRAWQKVPETELNNSLTQVFVPSSRIPLFANLAKYNLNGESTETRSSDASVNLESLLDFSKCETITYDGIIIEQIPFKPDGFLAGIGPSLEYCDEDAVEIKKFYIVKRNPEKTYHYIATMIPKANFVRNHPDFTFLDSPDYSGIVLFSKLDGKLFEARTYSGGLIKSGKLLRAEEIDEEKASGIQFFKLVGSSGTRAWNLTIDDPSYCIDEDEWWKRIQNNAESGDYNWNDWETDYDETDDQDDGDGGGSGGNSSGEGGLDGETFKVRLSVNDPESVHLTGSGTYKKNAKVTIDWQQTAPPPLLVKFKRWSGDLADKNTARLAFAATQDIEAHAYFENGTKQLPCISADKVSVPLLKMNVAPSSAWTNWEGGTFGYTRWRGGTKTKYHSGLDLAAEPGTEVFSMYDGTIIRIYDTATGEEDDAKANKCLGNEIRIEVTLADGSKIEVSYAHLDADTPVADNERKGRVFKYGDKVFAGELIGYSGRTGNAWNTETVPVAHVHIGVRRNGQWVDPKDYINGTYNLSTLNSTNGQITGIKCY